MYLKKCSTCGCMCGEMMISKHQLKRKSEKTRRCKQCILDKKEATNTNDYINFIENISLKHENIPVPTRECPWLCEIRADITKMP